MLDTVTIGVNILEILTTGMYRDSRVIFREYIQNACDQIDVAINSGLLNAEDAEVNIWVDSDSRTVTVEDNATGIESTEFKKTLYTIGESGKILGKAKGFRGIGHWCGLGYCKTLVFSSKAKGENVESIMTCDAEKMRQMMADHNSHEIHYTVDEVLSATVQFERKVTDDIDEHYFKVTMVEISDLHSDLYTVQRVKEYLSFVAPVRYDPSFRFRDRIHGYAQRHNHEIQEYSVLIEGEPITKKYVPSFTTSKGDDSITDVDFRDFKDSKGNVIAWLWFGISRFQGVLKIENAMRGIRLRSKNIQIGDSDTLQKLFKEDRGNNYFVGEVFAISNELIPNSQRDYFNENAARKEFEQKLSEFFNDELTKIYKQGSSINSKYDKIEKAQQIEKKFLSTTNEAGLSLSDAQRKELERAKIDAETAARELDKIRVKSRKQEESGDFSIADMVVRGIIDSKREKHTSHTSHSFRPTAARFEEKIVPSTTHQDDSQKLVPLGKVSDIIREFADTLIAEAIIAKIEKVLL